ncbi:hypothetical protein P7K49_039996 [Saguinus oedipus]|uniref:Uncharacterized protein n=1 Tax=Saguinus oedipus TaxID=9490 RepID=A0ABQ9TDI9_SAGOE|nr:hypothetical protein P7K49_039996 [Saguinus oedipus]
MRGSPLLGQPSSCSQRGLRAKLLRRLGADHGEAGPADFTTCSPLAECTTPQAHHFPGSRMSWRLIYAFPKTCRSQGNRGGEGAARGSRGGRWRTLEAYLRLWRER